MIREITRDVLFLSIRSQPATEADIGVTADLTDTLKANADRCVGMAANMIGFSKRIIIFDDNGKYTVMFNLEIIKASDPYEAEEGCLSLDGTRKVKRYKSIKVSYQNENMSKKIKSYSGFTAEIIQHEIDHLNGIII